MADNAQLKPLLLEVNNPLFAVLDGAQFKDLPSALFDGNFVYRSLYLDRGTGTADQLRTAPQLVWLDRRSNIKSADEEEENPADSAILDSLVDLLEDRAAVIFWQCSVGGDALYRHLRGINQVLYPKPAYIDRDTEIPESGFEMVTFRHADANVVAQISSAMDWNGLSRLLGPAEALLFAPDEDWSPKPMRVQRHPEMSSPYRGPLKLGSFEIRNMGTIRFEWLTRRTVKYLNEYAPGRIEGTSDQAMTLNVKKWLHEAQASGVSEEAAFRKWCYLQVLHDGRLMQSGFAIDFSKHRDTSVSADERVDQMMKYMIERAEAA